MILGILGIWVATAAIAFATVAYALLCRAARQEAVAETAATGNGHANGSGNGHSGGNGRVKLKGARVRETRRVTAPTRPLPSIASLAAARRAFALSALGVFLAAGTLMTLVVGRHYEVAYIWGHSDNSLPVQYRIASFWAGQEGTFLLWAIYGSILGLMLIRRARDYERWVMPFFCGIQLFLLTILCVMSPFKLHDLAELAKSGVVPPNFQAPDSAWVKALYFFGIGNLFTPINGMGLNISLQNPWMVIHPPIIFIGFSALAVPGCFALAALARRDYSGWVRKAASWTIFGWMAIGFGKFLGGYWAYETLGWGGYWAWDPVENTSIVPWVFGTALIHGMMVQQARASLKQANLFLALLTFLSVLYGTFLTRSGVLGEFSVHSFTAPALAVYIMMLGIMGLWAVGGFGLLAARFREIQSESAYDRLNERPFGFFLAVILLIGAGSVICIGMSWPLISPAIFGKARSINFDFYNRALLPVATFMCLLLSITPFMPWRKTGDRPSNSVQKLITGMAGLILLIGLPAAGLAWHGGTAQIQSWLVTTFRIPESLLQPGTGFSPAALPAILVFFAAAGLGVLANLIMFARTVRGGLLQTGAWVSHIAICVGFMGVVVTSVFSSTKVIVLAKGETASVHGYQLDYQGFQTARPPEKDYLQVRLSEGGDHHTMRLPWFTAPGQEMPVTRPAVQKFFGHDIYLAGRWSDGSLQTEVKRGETITAGEFQITLRDFQHENLPKSGRAATAPIIVRPVLDVRAGGVATTVTPAYKISLDGRVEQQPAALPGGTHQVLVERIMVPNEAEGVSQPGAKLFIKPTRPVDLVQIEATYKPGIDLVWFGGYLLLFGAFLAFRRRSAAAAAATGKEETKSAGETQAEREHGDRRRKEPALPRR